MKKGKIFFHPIDGTGSLTISWTSASKGDATEADKGSGVGFFSDKGNLLAVIFDEVKEHQDKQVLEFDQIAVEVTVKEGKVEYVVTNKTKKTALTNRRSRNKTSISK